MSSTADSGLLSPQRQFLTLMFCDLCGSSQLADLVELEVLAELLERVRTAVATAVLRHGGRVVRTQGDGSLAVFGYPVPSEHDARRACQAALEAHADVAMWPASPMPGGTGRLALHTGVHAGLVYVSPGDRARGELDVVGDAANTAARLASIAPRGSILADADSLGPELMFFETSAVELVTLPGRTLPVRAVHVRGLSRLQRRIDASYIRGLSPFHGRKALMAELLQACTRAERQRRVIEIRGPAGIGKTRLLDELARRLAGLGISSLRGGCESFGLTPVLEPFRQLLASQALASQPAPASISRGDVPDLRDRCLELLIEHDHPHCVVLLDDWHWADEASRRLLGDVLNATSRLLVVVASRESEGLIVGNGHVVMRPQPLTRLETELIVQTLVPSTDPFLVDELHEYAGGVPLFIEEVCHVLRDRGEAGWQSLRRSAGRTQSSSGTWMRSMMAARVDGLDERVWSAAQAAAVVGLRVPRWLFEELVPGGLDEPLLDQLASADLLYPDGPDAFRFRHGLSRDALYDLIPLQRRTALHRLSLSLLERTASGADPAERLEALAHHASAAANWVQALQFCEEAGEHAMRLGAFDKARRQFFTAIEAAQSLGVQSPEDQLRWCTLIHRLAMTCTFDPLALPQALTLVERCTLVARALGDSELLARSLYWEAYLRFVFGQPRQSVALARESKALAESSGNARLLAQVNATLGQALAAVCSYPEALDTLQLALQVKQAHAQHRGALAIGSAYTLACVAGVHADRGDFGASHTALARARELVAGHPNHPIAYSVRNWEVIILAWQQRWGEAIEVMDATVELVRRLKALLPLAIARAVGGYARWRLETEPQAITDTIEAVRWMENHQVLFYTPLYYGWLVEMAVDAGRIDEARRWAARVLRRARTGERLGEAVVWRALARVAHGQGDIPRAWQRLGRAEASARRRESSREAALNLLLKAQLLRDEMRHAESAQWQGAALEQMAAMGMATPLTR